MDEFSVETPLAIEMRRIMIRLARTIDFEAKQVLLITSSERGEGKSIFSLHFSVVLAHHLGKRVVLVDGDMRRAVQHKVFKVPLSPGFAELLGGSKTVQEVVRSTRLDKLGFVPAGLPEGHVSLLFREGRVRDAVDQLRKVGDVIIMDCPPVVPVSDPLHYVEAADGVIYMVMAGKTHKDVVKRGVDILQGAGARMLGVVANNVGEVLPYYYDSKYYGYEAKRTGG